jgi:hypothetical protein
MEGKRREVVGWFGRKKKEKGKIDFFPFWSQGI